MAPALSGRSRGSGTSRSSRSGCARSVRRGESYQPSTPVMHVVASMPRHKGSRVPATSKPSGPRVNHASPQGSATLPAFSLPSSRRPEQIHQVFDLCRSLDVSISSSVRHSNTGGLLTRSNVRLRRHRVDHLALHPRVRAATPSPTSNGRSAARRPRGRGAGDAAGASASSLATSASTSPFARRPLAQVAIEHLHHPRAPGRSLALLGRVNVLEPGTGLWASRNVLAGSGGGPGSRARRPFDLATFVRGATPGGAPVVIVLAAPRRRCPARRTPHAATLRRIHVLVRGLRSALTSATEATQRSRRAFDP